MEPTAVTTQPLRSPDPIKEVSAVHSPTYETGHIEKQVNSDSVKECPTDLEPLTEVTTAFDSDAGHNEEEKEKKRGQNWQEDVATDCCCVYTGNSDPFCFYILCHWICDCFRGIGECTDNCFEGCADCLGNCCESGTADGGNGGDCCCSCDGDCLSSCLECCTCDGCSEIAGCLECCASCDCSS